MKRGMVLVGLAALVVAGPLALAGDYHRGASLFCSQCHVMHYSQSHGYNANGSGTWTPLATGPHEYLLRQDFNDLCLFCHDNNQIAPDVFGVNTGKYPTDVRLAGYLNRVGVGGEQATGHTLDLDDAAPGSQPEWKPSNVNGTGNGLRCVNCHSEHGSTSGVTGGNGYRNLRTNAGNNTAPAGYISYAIATNDLTKDAFERESAKYDESKVDFNEPDSTKSAYAAYCKGCHTNFHGLVGGPELGGVPIGNGYEEFHRHPTAGVNIGAVGGGHSSLSVYNNPNRVNRVKVMSPTGVWTQPTFPADITPTCFSCHKSHGNGNPFGLLFRKGSGTLTENGDSDGVQLENLCGQCHRQGAAFSVP